MLKGWGNFLTNPRYHRTHAILISLALIGHGLLHYATYIPAFRDILGTLPYFRLHVLHESEFLLVVVYAALVFRLKGGLTAVGITALTSIPFLLTPYIFDRAPRTDEIRDLAIQVAFILLMGTIISILYEIVARERERKIALAVQVEEANVQLSLKNQEAEQLNQRLETTNRQLSALNRTIQSRVNQLYGDLEGAIGEERNRWSSVPSDPSNPTKEHISRFIEKVDAIIKGPE